MDPAAPGWRPCAWGFLMLPEQEDFEKTLVADVGIDGR